MYTEIDLELYTIAIVRLNTAFEKLNDGNEDIEDLLDASYKDLKQLSEAISNNLSQNEVNNEIETFCTYSVVRFISYQNQLQKCRDNNPNLNESLSNLINIFNELYQLSNQYFKKRNVIL